MAIQWDPALAIGDAEIDAQHQEIFRRLDLLLEAARNGRGRDEVGKLIAFLGDYVVSHFAAEEALMREHAYPRQDEHRAEHKAFIADLGVLVGEYQRDGATASLVIRVNTRVVRWLYEHIAGTDRRLGSFLQRTSARVR